MEYLLGKDCRIINKRANERKFPLDHQHALLIVSRICAGLDYAHKLKDFQGKARNIIHRDISPQNIIITYEGDVKIVDFGIAKAASQNTHTQMGMIKGKVAYMSPEQAAGKVIDHRSDIFSCGIILYELITGKRMFAGDTMHILSKIRDAEYTIPEDIHDNLPEKLLEVFDRALQKEPKDRYQTCGEMLNDLEECMQLGSGWSLARVSRELAQLIISLAVMMMSVSQSVLPRFLHQRLSYGAGPSAPLEQEMARAEVEARHLGSACALQA